MKIITLFIVLLSIGFISALPNDLNNKIDFKYTSSTSTNYSSINVNNSLFWQGHTGTDGSWLTNTQCYNSSYVPYTGATGDINIGEYYYRNIYGYFYGAGITTSENTFTVTTNGTIFYYSKTWDAFLATNNLNLGDKLYNWKDLFLSRTAFIGNITLNGTSGNTNNSGNVTANYFIGNGSLLTGVGKANYNFTNNNFNGSGSFTTTGNGKFRNLNITSNVTFLGLVENYDDRRMVTTDTSGNISYKDLNNAFSLFSDDTGQFVLYSTTTNNLLYAGDKRFTVTITNFSSTSAGTLANLFDGNTDQYNFPAITTNNTNAIIFINLTSKGEYLQLDGLVYPWGDIYVHFYSKGNISNVSARLQIKSGSDLIWTSTVQGINITNPTAFGMLYKIPMPNNNWANAIEINITVGTQSLLSDPDYKISVSEVEFFARRSVDYKLQPVLSKNAPTNSLYGDMSFKNTNNDITVNIEHETGNLNITGNLTVQRMMGLTGNYTNGNCWQYFKSGVMTATNCTVI